MDTFIEVNLEKCTACRLCEFACSTHNFGEINPAKSRIKVTIVAKDFFYYPNVCQQCGKAPCVEACPQENALIRSEKTGAVEANADDCIGCRICKALDFWNNPSETCVKVLADHGTIGVVSFTNDLGILPTRNFQTGAERFLNEPMPDGPSKGQVFEQDQILPEYYKLRGWDENGIPETEKLEELNIEMPGVTH